MFDEECNHPVTKSSYGGFEEDLSPPIYDEYEDDYLDNALEELAVYNHRLDHLEEFEGPKWDLSSRSLNSECQEEYISPDFLEEVEDSKWNTSLHFFNSYFFSCFY